MIERRCRPLMPMVWDLQPKNTRFIQIWAVKEIVLSWEHKYYGISQSTDRGGDMGGRHPHTRTISNKMYNQHKTHAALACPPPS
jgi:hypothetical protein